MKIISKFQDYYDIISKSQIDKNVLYFRNQEIFELPRIYELGEIPKTGSEKYRLHILGYCGKIIHVYELMFSKYSSFYYDFESFRRDALAYKVLEEKDFKGTFFKKSVFEKFINQETLLINNYFKQYDTPVFIISNSIEFKRQILLTNPHLYSLSFDSIRISYEVHNDIYNYIKQNFNENREDIPILC